MKGKGILLSMLLLLTLVLAACEADTGEGTALPGEPTEPGIGEELEATPGEDMGGEGLGEETSTSEPEAGAVEAGENQVVMRDEAFDPADITVPAGTTVTWTNEDTEAHTVVAGTAENPTGEFDSGIVDVGQTFEFTFDGPGTYDYFCQLHDGMSGTVTVE